ncbi:hypothetical protein ACQKWADRAFT_281345 [Trichoderma austrokoningii]
MPPSNAAAGALFSPASLNLPNRERGRDRDRPDQQLSLSVVRTSSKERKASFSSLKASLPGSRRRANNASGTATPSSSGAAVTNASAPPALPDHALAAAAKIVVRDKDRDAAEGAEPANMIPRGSAMAAMTPATPIEGRPGMTSTMWALAQGEQTQVLHHQITELAQKRMSTLDYLRKAHEGRVYWFNTYLFDKPDLSRMPSFDPRKLSRKATNYLLLGLSIPTIHDLYSSTPLEFLRCLNALLAEFDSFQQLHGDSSNAALSRARLPNMFRRPGIKTRRSTSADVSFDDSSASGHQSPAGGSTNGGPAPAVMNFAASESDLLPGEEYTYLLTPSLPFDPDFFETFATLCDVLIDCYTKFLTLVPSPRECTAPVAELFTKADSKIRKIIVQGVVKDFEDHSRMHVKSEVAGIGKVVLGGLM